jgi:uracil phosphoribosyltransferase
MHHLINVIELFPSRYPDVQIFTAAINPILNEHEYIVTGLGDEEERMY